MSKLLKANVLICPICKKEINDTDTDQLVLGHKDDYMKVPANVTPSELVFMHFKCLKQYAIDNKLIPEVDNQTNEEKKNE